MSERKTMHAHHNNGLSGGQIALITIGGVLVIGLVASLAAWLMTNKRRNKSTSKANIVQIGGGQIGGVVNNEQQPVQTVDQAATPVPTTQNNTIETNDQSPADNNTIQPQDKDQPIADVASAETPQDTPANEPFIEQKDSEDQEPEITTEEPKQEEENENDFVKSLTAAEEEKSNVDEDEVGDENDQTQEAQKVEALDDAPDHSNEKTFSGFPLGMMTDANKGENLQPNFEKQQPKKQPIPVIVPITRLQNQNVNISAEQPNLMPQANEANNFTNQQQQYVNEPKNEQKNAEKLEYPVDFTYQQGDFKKLMQAGRLKNPFEQLPLEKEIDNINYLKQLHKQEEEKQGIQELKGDDTLTLADIFGGTNLKENKFNIEKPKASSEVSELPTQPQNDIHNLFAAKQTNQQADKNEKMIGDGIVMPLNMLPVQNQDLEQKPMDNNVLSAPPKFVRIKKQNRENIMKDNAGPAMVTGGNGSPVFMFNPNANAPKLDKIKNQNMESIMEDNARPAMITLGNSSPVSMFQPNANVENSQIDDGMFNKPNFLQEPMPKNDFSNKPAMPNNSMFNRLQPINENEIKPDTPAFMPPMMKIEDKNENKGAPMMQIPLAQMFAEPMKTNQGAQLDKNNSNQNENEGAPMGNPMFNFLMPNKNNSKNEQMNQNNGNQNENKMPEMMNIPFMMQPPKTGPEKAEFPALGQMNGQNKEQDKNDNKVNEGMAFNPFMQPPMSMPSVPMKNGNNSPMFSALPGLGGKPMEQTNNNQSKTSLETQNKCTCALCSSGGGN